MKPPAPPNPRERAIQRALTFRDDWEDFGHDPNLAPATARALLAAWGNLYRLFEPTALPADVASLPMVVQEAASCLLYYVGHGFEPSDWLAKSQSLVRAWDYAVDRETQNELELAALQMVDELDEDSLAVCMARRLPGAAETAADQLAEWTRQLTRNEAFFATHLDAFLPAAPRVVAFLNACRADLDQNDPELWETTLKHRQLEELAEEVEAEPLPLKLREQDRRELLLRAAAPRQAVLQALIVLTLVRGIHAYSRRMLASLRMGHAGTAEEAVPSERIVLSWRKPEGTVEASALVPRADTSAAGSEPVRVNLYVVDTDEPALDLAGPDHRVSLAGIERPPDQRARVTYTLQELHDAGQDLVLAVDGEPWPAVPHPDSENGSDDRTSTPGATTQPAPPTAS